MTSPLLSGHIMITGASSGIGEAMARQLAPTAKALSIVARRRERLEQLATHLKAINPELEVNVVTCDIAETEAVDQMIATTLAAVGEVDVLINNAGFGDVMPLERSDWAKLRQMIAVNVTGLAYLTHRLLPSMIERRFGGILNVSSGFGLTFAPAFATYAGSKHFVSAFTESLRLEVMDMGVTVSQLCPGPVSTEFEDIADSPFAEEPPKFVYLSARRCAEVALKKFAKGKALIVPGFWANVMLGLGRITPRPILRFVMRRLARVMRRQIMAGDG